MHIMTKMSFVILKYGNNIGILGKNLCNFQKFRNPIAGCVLHPAYLTKIFHLRLCYCPSILHPHKLSLNSPFYTTKDI